MEVVRTFNNELSSLYETKPPVSKAKMTQVTKSAIKGLKYYKHIVQSVEKFIQKCRPEYKVPGLYVIDSIVRQSRHQFGADKDVFGPRFSKNFVPTFQNLFKCVDEDRSKIVRVLNLWQKNAVFPSNVIQPLLDMGNPNTHNEFPNAVSDSVTHNSKSKSADLSAWKNWPQGSDESFEDNHQNYAEVSTRNLEKFAKANSAADSVQSSQAALPVKNDAEPPQEENTVKFNKKLLDFDYGDEDEEDETPTRTEEDQLENAPENNPLALSMAQNLLSNPELLRQLQQMQQTIQQSAALQSELQQQQHNTAEPDAVRERFSPDPPAEPVPPVPLPTQPISSIPYPDTLPPNVMPSYPYEQSLSNIPAPPQPQMNNRANEWMMDSIDMGYPPPPPQQQQQQQPIAATHENDIIQASQVDEDHRVLYSMPGEPPLPALPPQDLDERSMVLPMVEEQQDAKNNSRSRSDSRSRRSGRHRSRSRSPRRRRSRSRSRSRSRRKRSRSRERERERQREREREREKEHGRKKRGIPPIKKNSMTVCSTTLWLGHVPKTMSEAEINSLLGEYGNVLSIDMIPPRGCAYVAMDRRQDAYRALQKLKTEKMKGSSIKVAWAPGKGMKGKEYKEYWEMDGGVSYIPYEKLPNDVDTLDLLEEGGFIDEDSMPTHLREMRLQEKDKLEDMEISTIENTVTRHGSKDIPMSSAPIVTSSMMPPSSMGMPMMGMPQMMQPPQYGMPMPGMMPNQPPMVVPLPVGVPPPNPMMMVQPPSQGVLGGTPLPVGTVPQMPHMPMQHPSIPAPSSGLTNITTTPSKSDASSSQTSSGIPVSGDATPTEEDGTIISSPSTTNPSHTHATVMSNSPVTAAHMGAQFGTAMGHHGMVRPMMPVMPPVSSAGTPIPFPPPQVGFGFPPPPMRPAVPNQNMAGVIPMPNSPFQWLQKATNPAFGAFGDSDMRYPLHTNNAGAVRQPAPALAQPSGGMDTSGLSNVNQQQAQATQTTNMMPSKEGVGSTPEKDSESRRESGGSDAFPDKNGNNVPHVDAFGRSKDISNDLRRPNKDESRDQMAGGAFGEADKMPRFPGPPDFQSVPGGGIRMPWMHGPPGPRFPHAFNPNVPPFPPRGAVPRPMHQPMDMDFFRHQVPRMHMPGPLPPPPQQPPQRWKNDGYAQQRNQDRYPNRRDFRDNRMEEDDQGRGHRPREEWGHRRDRWEDAKGRRNDDREDSSRGRDRERGMWSDDKSGSEHVHSENKSDERKDVAESSKEEKTVQSKPKQKSDSFGDLAADLFRLQRYGKGRVSIDVSMNVPKSKKDGTTKEKNVKSESAKQDTPSKEETSKGASIETPSNIDIGNKNVAECENAPKPDDSQITNVSVQSTVKEPAEDNQSSQNSSTTSDPPSVKIIDVKVGGNEEGRKGRERDRKRSRWGRTLSQEREFQQQMGTEKKLLQDDVVIPDLQQVAVPPLPESDISLDIAMAPTSGDEFLKTDTDSISLDCGATAEQSVCPDLPVDAVSAVPASNDIAQDSTDTVVEGEPMPLS